MNLPAQRRLYAAVGQKIRDRRKAEGITQEQLAKTLKMSRGSLANIESGRQRVLLNTLYDIAEALGIAGGIGPLVPFLYEVTNPCLETTTNGKAKPSKPFSRLKGSPKRGK